MPDPCRCQRLTILLACAASLLLPLAGRGLANETPVVGIGGAYHPLHGESTVRLVREFLDIRLSPRRARTTVQFELRNEGPARTIAMGFPEQVVYARTSYRAFQVTVDGHRLAARPTRWEEIQSGTMWRRWWVSRLRFARGARRHLRVSYEERPTGSYGGYTYWYLFGTGRPWKGPIGTVEGRLTLVGFPPEATVYVGEGFGVTRTGNTLAWRLRNWEPNEEDTLNLMAWPAIIDVSINGGDVDPPMFLRLHRGHLEGGLADFRYWMGGEVTDAVTWSPSTRTLSYQHRGRTLLLTIGKPNAVLLPGRATVKLPFAPFLEAGQVHAPLRPTLEALGLRVDIRQKKLGNWQVSIYDPRPRPSPAAPSP